MRRFPPVVLGALALLPGVLRAPSAAAEGATVAVDCPMFDDEARAALDARARAELLVREQGGTLIVACRGNDATLTWHPLDGHSLTRVAPLDTDPRTSIDQILEALDALLASSASASAGGARPDGALTAPAVEQAAPIVAPSTPPKGPESRPEPQASEGAERTPEPTKRHRRLLPVLFGVGATGELWSGSEALGAHGFATLPLPSRFSVSVTGGLWALRSPNGVTANLVRVAAGGDYGIDPGDHFRVGADVFVDFVHAASATAGSDDQAIIGAALRATAGFEVDAVRFQLGPTVAAHPGKVLMQIGSTEAFHIPTFALGLTLDAIVGF